VYLGNAVSLPRVIVYIFAVEAVAVRGHLLFRVIALIMTVVSFPARGLLADQGPMIFSNIPKLYSPHDYPSVGLLWSHYELVMTGIKIFPVHSATEF